MAQVFLLARSIWLASGTTTDLNNDWRLVSSEKLGADITGADISRGDYNASSWLELRQFPTTVMDLSCSINFPARGISQLEMARAYQPGSIYF